MVENLDCIEEVTAMCKEKWQANEIARGDYWLEIEWERHESERKFMLIYGKEKIDTVAQIISHT